jgi:hypothetical protein
MVARMNRVEDAARLSMADLGPEAAPARRSGMTVAVRLALVIASCALAGLIAVNLF